MLGLGQTRPNKTPVTNLASWQKLTLRWQVLVNRKPEPHPRIILLIHIFFKSEEIIIFLRYIACTAVRLMRVFMLRVKELYDLETTTIYIEMNVAFIKIWCMCFPYLCFGM